MDDFYTLTPDRQVKRLERLVRKALPAWGINEDAALRLIGYRENAVFEVRETGSSDRYALKVHREAYHSDAALESEMQWMDALRDSGVFTPTFLRTRTGERFHRIGIDGVPGIRQIDLSAWVDGRQLADLHGDNHNVEMLARSFRIVGETAARMHLQVRDWSFPPGFTRHAWDEDGLFGEQPVWGRFWEVDEATGEQQALLGRVRIALAERLRNFGKGPDRYGLIHADLEPENILVTDGNTLVIDFDDSGFGWNLYDAATALYASYMDGVDGDFKALRDTWISGYRSVTELPEAHLEILPVLLLTRVVTVVGWCHTRRETETATRERDSMIEAACGLAEDFLSGS